jgi:hypothetical protein
VREQKYIIWYNTVTISYNCGTREKYNTMKQFYGDSAILAEEFIHMSEHLVQKITDKLNRNLRLTEESLDIE